MDIEELQLELTTICNSDCIMCPRGKLKRGIGTMSKEFALYVIDEAVKLGAKTIKLEWFGETLTVPYWYQIAKYAKHKGMRTLIFTNGSLLTNGNRKRVLDYIDKITVSIDSSNPKEYEKIRKGLRFRVVSDNLKALFEERNNEPSKTKIVVAKVKTESTDDDMDYFRQYSDEVVVNKDITSDWDGKKREVRCLHNAPVRLVVGWDGKCYLCCHDWIGEYPIGDLKRQSIKEILEGEERQKLLSNLGNLEICQRCVQNVENTK